MKLRLTTFFIKEFYDDDDVTEVHWRIIANLGFKFRYTFTALVIAVPGQNHGCEF